MLEWALAYASIGWHIFPLRTQGDLKRPHQMLDRPKGTPGGHLLASRDPSRVRSWWQAEPTAGIGLFLARSGLLALDADTYKPGVAQALEKLFTIHGPFSSPVQADTGGGGVHTLFAASEAARCPGKLAGKAGLDLKHQGYIVLAPSPHSRKTESGAHEPTGQRYHWREGLDPFGNLELLPLAPSWFFLAGDKSVTVAGSADPDDVFAEDTPKAGISLDQAETLLAAVPNDGSQVVDYETWLGVLGGLYHEFDGSDEARALAEAWSADHPSHDPEKFDRTWRSLDIQGKGRAPTTIRLLIKLGAEKLKEASSVAARDLRAELAECFDKDSVLAVCRKAAGVQLDRLDRTALAQDVRKLLSFVTGTPIPLALARSLIAFEQPAAVEGEEPEWMRDYVFLTNENVFIKPGQENGISKQAFDGAYNRFMLTPRELAAGVTSPQNTASNTALNFWKIPVADSRMYWPGEESFFTFRGQRCFNTFSTAEMPPIPSPFTDADRLAVKVVREHVAHLIEGRRERELFLSWLAYIVQTHKRPNWAIILQSPEGEGKSFFAELMGAVLGSSNVSVLDTSVLTGRFTGWAHGHLLKIVEEIKLHGADRYKILDTVKPYITNPTVTIEAKRENNRTIRNTAAYLMFTNYRDSIPVTENDTRYFMIASPRQTADQTKAWKQQLGENYFKTLFSSMESHAGAVRGWLMGYKLHAEFSPTNRAPFSAEKEYVVRLNVGTTEEAIDDILHAGHVGLNGVLCDATVLGDKLVSEEEIHATPQAIAALLSKKGYTFLSKVRVDGRYRRFWSQNPKQFLGAHQTQTHNLIRRYLDKTSTSDL